MSHSSCLPAPITVSPLLEDDVFAVHLFKYELQWGPHFKRSLFLPFFFQSPNYHELWCGHNDCLCFTEVLTWPQLLSVIYKGLVYLFGVLCLIQHCTGHIMTGSWKGRENQYIQLVKVLYCKLQQQATSSFPTWGRARIQTLISEVGGECVITAPPWSLYRSLEAMSYISTGMGYHFSALFVSLMAFCSN